MPSSAQDEASRAYAEKQARLVAFLNQSSDLLRQLHRPNPDDRFVLHYPASLSVQHPA